MCGAQHLQCKSKSSPQIIGAHQPHQACYEYTQVQSQQGGIGGTSVGTAEPHCQNPVA